MDEKDRPKTWRDFLVQTSAQVAGGAVLAILIASLPYLVSQFSVVTTVVALGALGFGTSVVAFVFGFKRRHRLARQLMPTESVPITHDAQSPSSPFLLNLPIIGRNVEINIDLSLAMRADHEVRIGFGDLNARREALGLMSYYDALRYIPVSYSRETGKQGRFVIGVAPIDYSVFAMINDPMAPPEIRSSTLQRLLALKRISSSIRAEGKSGHVGLLGSQSCLVTSDKRILLRKRGANVLFARDRWDVSVSGFCGRDDVLGNGTQLDFSRTIEHETTREIGHVRGDPRRIQPVGLTRNLQTGAIDILAYWQIESTSMELARLLTMRPGSMNRVFDTEIKAIERYVWDSKNLIVNLGRSDISYAWTKCGVQAKDFEPQSLLCIDLTLERLMDQKKPSFLDAWEGI